MRPQAAETDLGALEPAVEAVLDLMKRKAGLVFLPERRPFVAHVVHEALERLAGSTDAAAVLTFIESLERRDDVFDALIDDLVVGETYFLRDAAQFRFIVEHIIPHLVRNRPPAHVFRVWSAGCATGEEAYSLAIAFEEAGLGNRVRILGTDISRSALARARSGEYGRWSLRGVDEALLRRHFLPRGDARVVRDALREVVRFDYLNLAQDSYPSLVSGIWAMDLILCRNVLIYLDRRTVEQVIARLWASLADGGWLLTAPSDPPIASLAPFQVVVADAGVFYQRPETPDRVPAAPAAQETPDAVPDLASSSKDREARSQDLPDEASPRTQFPRPDRPAAAQTSLPVGAAGPPGRAPSESAPGSVVTEIRTLANRGDREALGLATRAVARFPLSAELHVLHGLLLLDAGQAEKAVRALRQALYLDPSLTVAHFALGHLYRRCGNLPEAARCYRNALALVADLPPESPVPLADGETARALSAAARAQLAMLGQAEGGSP